MRAIQHTSKAFHSGALPCFYLRAAISSRRLHTSLRNPIKMTDYILSPQDLSFRKIYKSTLIMWKNAEIWRTINLVWYVFYSNLWGAAETCNSPVLVLLNKRIRQLICISAYSVSSTVHKRLVFCASLGCCYLIQTNRVTVVPWPCDSGKACFTLDLCHYPPTTSQGRQSRDPGRPGEILSPDIKKDAHRDLSPSLPGIQFHSANICQR